MKTIVKSTSNTAKAIAVSKTTYYLGGKFVSAVDSSSALNP